MEMTPGSHDLIVLGCGIAGLSAAVAAADRGFSVLLLERATFSERGGNTRYTEAFLRMKSETETSDDFEEHFAVNAGGNFDPSLVAETTQSPQTWPSILKAMSFADPELITAFAREVPPTIQWLKGFGVRFEALPTPFLTRSAPKLMPIGGGLALIDALAAKAEGLGVQFHYETVGLDLIQDVQGAVAGVRAACKGHQIAEFRSSNVVLACGGFEGNAEMLTQYLGPHALALRPVARGGHYNKGEGIRMALKIGAAPCGDYGNYHAEPIDPRSGIAEPAIFVFPYGILVNQLGKRFVDEAPGPVDSTYEGIAREIARQPGGIAFAILDRKIADVPNYSVAIRSDQPAIEAGSLSELAAKLDVPSKSLQVTVRLFNEACKPGRFAPLELDELTTEGADPEKSNFARPIDHPPFKAYPVISANVFTFGGLKVNGNAQVLNVQGDPIPGLYAAGEVVGMYYKAYTGATSVLKGAAFGRLAGRHAERQRPSHVNAG